MQLTPGLVREYLAELRRLLPHGLIADGDAVHDQQHVHCTQAAREAAVEPSLAWSLGPPVSYPAIIGPLDEQTRHPVTNVRAPDETFRNDCNANLDYALI